MTKLTKEMIFRGGLSMLPQNATFGLFSFLHEDLRNIQGNVNPMSASMQDSLDTDPTAVQKFPLVRAARTAAPSESLHSFPRHDFRKIRTLRSSVIS